MVPDRTTSRIAIAALITVAFAGAPGCAHRRAPDLRVSSTPNRSVAPGVERGRTRDRLKANEKSSAREAASAAGLPSAPESEPAARENGPTSFGTSVVMTPQPAPTQGESATGAADRTRASKADASGHPLLGTILIVLVLVAGWALGRAMLTRRVPG
jgi:cobalamin biosynthesis Mg chelatase CobN